METSATAGEVKQQVKHLGLGQQGSCGTIGPWRRHSCMVRIMLRRHWLFDRAKALSGTSAGGIINTDQVRAWCRNSALNDAQPVVAFWRLQVDKLSLGQWRQRCA